MGLFDFVGDLLGTQNKDKANPQTIGTGARDYYGAKTGGYFSEDQKRAASQEDFLKQLQLQASGQGPSVADAFSRQAADQALSNSMAMAQSARGDINPAMAFRNAMNSAASQRAQANQQGAVMRQQEMLNAGNLYANALGQARGQAQNMYQFLEGLGMQGDLANLQSANQAQSINMGIGEANKGRNQQTVGGILSGAGQIAAASDERVKKNIHDAKADMNGFLDALGAHSYEYKDKADGAGEYYSPMAQELEKHPVGESMVLDTPRGKMVDYGRGFGAILAAQAALHERMKKLEKGA